MPRWLLGLFLAASAAGAIFFTTMNGSEDQETAANLPPDPAGRRAALLQALANSGYTGAQAQILLGQAMLETGNFTSKEFPLCLSPWNRHVGSGGYGDWNGQVCMMGPSGSWQIYASDADALKDDPTNAKEHLRCFDSLEQACRDMTGLLGLTLYANAAQDLRNGDANAYAEDIAEGDGSNGFVGPVNTAKAQNYTAGLLSQFAALGVA